MKPLGYVGQTLVVRVTFPGGESAEVEFPVMASVQSIFHRLDVKLKLKYPEMTGRGQLGCEYKFLPVIRLG